MTPDISAIRAALAAAAPGPLLGQDEAKQRLAANAPVWLTQCVDEIERLRALYVESEGVKGWDYANVVAERNAALAECKRLRIALMETAESES